MIARTKTRHVLITAIAGEKNVQMLTHPKKKKKMNARVLASKASANNSQSVRQRSNKNQPREIEIFLHS